MSKENNIFLIILAIPFRKRTDSKDDSLEIREGYSSLMLVGVLDPSQRDTTTPMTFIEFDSLFCDTYNSIINEMVKLRACYYEDGYLAHSSIFDEDEKKIILDKIDTIGHMVYQLIASDSKPLRDWFDKMIKKYKQRQNQTIAPENVTIITNDFKIPWYWMKNRIHSPFLNEICPLGLLQLDDPDEITESINKRMLLKTTMSKSESNKAESSLHALLIKGGSRLPFVEEELKSIENTIKAQTKPRKKNLIFNIVGL